MTFTINVFLQRTPAEVSKLDQILTALNQLTEQGKLIMKTEQDALDLLKKIDDSTNKQADGLTQVAQNLATTSDNLDKLISLAQQTPGIPDTVMQALQTEADRVQDISEHVAAQAAFSKALASKGLPTPVPVPVPDPLPPVEPVQPVAV